jgi:hypothetical protein
MAKETIKRNPDGHPCNGSCCDDPSVVTPEHECPPDAFCEECFGAECVNCGACCHCDL